MNKKEVLSLIKNITEQHISCNCGRYDDTQRSCMGCYHEHTKASFLASIGVMFLRIRELETFSSEEFNLKTKILSMLNDFQKEAMSDKSFEHLTE